ncbi:MAG: heme-binding protein [Gammaproteobacteria bacterium]|nr:heme-binding protein [Gammaproteobacteria bacterium]
MRSIDLDIANRMIDGVFAQAAARGLPHLAAAVLDPGGHLVALQRQDGVSFLRADICQGKAWGALAMGVDSRVLAERYTAEPQQQGFIHALQAMSGGRIVTLPGGVLIRDGNGSLLGALGVAGGPSEQDEACAIAAIEALGMIAG